MAHYTMDEYIHAPPCRPYCWGDRKYFDKKKGAQACKQCGFRDECEANLK